MTSTNTRTGLFHLLFGMYTAHCLMKNSQHNHPVDFFACHLLPRKMISQCRCSTCLHRIRQSLLRLQSTLRCRLTSTPTRQKILLGTRIGRDLKFDRNHHQSLVQPIFLQHKNVTMCQLMYVCDILIVTKCSYQNYFTIHTPFCQYKQESPFCWR